MIGPVWNRDLAKQTAGEKETCEIIDNITKILGVRTSVPLPLSLSRSLCPVCFVCVFVCVSQTLNFSYII